MKKSIVHAGMVTFFAAVLSLGAFWLALTIMGSSMDTFTIIMFILVPLLVAFPVSAYNHRQKRKIAKAHEALTAAHKELAAMHRRLAEKARHDDMTGLLNRAAFIDAVEEKCAQDSPGAFLLVDADNFKKINDMFGHLTGDEALRKIARGLEMALRKDDLKGRLGGEEFGVFISGATLEQASAIAERTRHAVEMIRFVPGDHGSARLTVSIGVAVAKKGAEFCELMDEADKRLYEAKSRGRNLVVMPASGSVAA
ncbi:GGDEF domain-containing protein [Chelativorans sp. YIM 93263]|uniref:GGDEF domain-containing protein n=1 Tax=Chelativorans sp. YIM 93263 TaxID=2906648 RepID=UPI00237997CE|nr:GGDEF domain-containing protein [Chelativorans sp. YIM 93263]